MPSAPILQHQPGIVLITGVTGDFGRAFAHRFAALECPLVLAARTPEKMEALITELKACGHDKLHPLIFDITNKKQMQAALDSLPAHYAQIDILINNAGLALGLDPAHKADLTDWETMVNVNINSLMRLTHHILPGMTSRKRGHIINIGSTAGTWPYPGGNVYGATKAFVKQFSLNLRADLAGTGVRVTNIEPGMVKTQFSEVRFKGDKAKAAEVYAHTAPLKPDDVAEAVLWAATLPAHVNINRIEIMPTAQSFGTLAVQRFG